MTWTIELSETAQKELRKLDREAARRIVRFLTERLAALDNPRAIGEALQGSKLGEFWKYRVGDYRLICSLEDGKLMVLVLRIGHRRQIYQRS